MRVERTAQPKPSANAPQVEPASDAGWRQGAGSAEASSRSGRGSEWSTWLATFGSYPLWWRVGVAVVAVALGTGLRLFVLSGIGPHAEFVTLFPAVAAAALIGRIPAGVVAASLSAVVAALWITPPTGPADLLGLAAYLFSAGIIIATAEGLHRSWEKATAAEAQTVLAAARERMADALHESEQRRRLALDASGAGTWVWDVATGKVTGDRAYRTMFGFGPDQEINVASWTEHLHPQDRERMRDYADACAKGVSDEWHEEFRVLHPERGERWLAGLGRAIRDSGGHLTSFAGINFDVTERKAAERALAENEAYLKALFDGAGDGIIVTDDNGIVQSFNPAAVAMFGYEADEVIGRNVSMLMPEPDRSPHNAYIRRYLVTRQSIVMNTGREVTGERKDGSTFQLELRLAEITLDDRSLFIGMARDVTARKKAEEELRQREALLQLGVRVGRLGIYERDFKSDVIAISPEMRSILGWDAEEPATVSRMLAAIHPEDLDMVKAAIQRAQDPEGNGCFNVENRIVRRDGTIHWIASRARTFFQGEGAARRPVRAVGATLDITERKRWEETQRLLIGELNHRVKNTLAMVQAIATQTLSRASSPEAFVESFNGRIHALAKAHTLLTGSQRQGADLRTLITDQLALGVAGSDRRIACSGPDVFLDSQAALHLGLVLHELGANARKHGSLSVPEGRLDVSWDVVGQGSGAPMLHLSWVESGGPEVGPPAQSGFGKLLIERGLKYSLDGEAHIDFAPAGLLCSIRLPLTAAEVRKARA